MKKPEKKCNLLVWGIPEKVRHQFKIRCLKNRKTIKEVIIHLMEEYVKNA